MIETLSQPVFQRLCLALLHFLWQGFLILLLSWFALAVLQGRAQVRYAVGFAGLLLMAACPLLTFVFNRPIAVVPEANRSAFIPKLNASVSVPDPFAETSLPDRTDSTDRTDAIPGSDIQPPVNASSSGSRTAGAKKGITADPSRHPLAQQETRPAFRFLDVGSAIVTVQPVLLLGWIGGVVVMSLRLIASYVQTRRLRRASVAVSRRISARAADLGLRMGIDVDQRLRASACIAEAVAVGFVRPIVLLPLCWITELPPNVLDAVIAHELAHIRRFDLWANLVQRLIETFLFYHPAVWWLSRRVRLERELCCDELALTAIGDRRAYALALEHVGRLAGGVPASVPGGARVPARRNLHVTSPLATSFLGDSNMNLLRRVKYVLAGRLDREPGRDWPVGALALGCLVLLAGLSFGMFGGSKAVLADGPREEEEQIAQARDRESPERGERRDDGERRDQPREGERRDQPRDGERREPPREGEGRDRPREGEGRDRPGPREGERPAPDRRREGEREEHRGPREGEGPGRPGPRPEGERGREPHGEAGPPRHGPGSPREAELFELIRQLQRELAELRREVQMLRGGRGGEGHPPGRPDIGGRPGVGPPPGAPRDGEPRRPDQRGSDRPMPDRPRDGAGERPGPRDGDRPADRGPRDGEGARPGPRDGDRPMPDRPRDGAGDRPGPRDGDRPAERRPERD